MDRLIENCTKRQLTKSSAQSQYVYLKQGIYLENLSWEGGKLEFEVQDYCAASIDNFHWGVKQYNDYVHSLVFIVKIIILIHCYD